MTLDGLQCNVKSAGCNFEGNFSGGNNVSDNYRAKKQRLKLSSEPKRKKGESSENTCSFCDEKGHTMRGLSCPPLRLYREYICDRVQVEKYKSGHLGCPTSHILQACPPIVQQKIKEREVAKLACVPWPLEVKHMVIRRAFYDCDVPHKASRYGGNPASGNNRRNILEVFYLKSYGAEVYLQNQDAYFYYRVEDLVKIIGNKIKGKRLLLSQLEKN